MRNEDHNGARNKERVTATAAMAGTLRRLSAGSYEYTDAAGHVWIVGKRSEIRPVRLGQWIAYSATDGSSLYLDPERTMREILAALDASAAARQ